jgi:quercetin dioxygenase-like cupin family protein
MKTLLLMAVILTASLRVGAQDMAPPHFQAAPEIYKVIGENDKFRVIEATWQPGQRDAWHSHSGAETAYRLTDCRTRIYTPDGKVREVDGKAGSVNFNPPIASHSFENAGAAPCRALIVQRK